MKLTLAQAQAAMHATGSIAGTEEFMPERAVTDNRDVQQGDLFFCIRGERVDGHDFAGRAIAAGAAAVVAERALPDMAAPVLVVDDSVAALGSLAGAHRARCSATVAGVTGTAGKTTVKELLAAALGGHGEVARNAMNLNNQIGMPVSMLAASGDERFWVMEAGISVRGDMDELGAVLRPDVATVVNVGPGHLEGLGDIRGVATQKSRLFAHLSEGGEGLVCFDYPELVDEARKVLPHVQGFSARGKDGPAGMVCTGSYVGPTETGGRYELHMAGDRVELEMPWRGAFMAESLAAAAATALLMGARAEDIAHGLAGARLPRQRFQIHAGSGVSKHWTVIDDSYNANPLSMARSMDAAANMAGGDGKRALVLVLGEMLELGAEAADAHREVGGKAAELRPDAVFWKGGHADDVEQGLGNGDFPGDFTPDAAPEDLARWLETRAGTHGVILIKGSRGTHMEEFTTALVGETE